MHKNAPVHVSEAFNSTLDTSRTFGSLFITLGIKIRRIPRIYNHRNYRP
jgi:hypothetical protein